MTPTERDARPVRLLHVPAMWPRSPREVRTSSQREITRRSCHARTQGGTQFFDRSRSFLTSLVSRPGFRLHEQRAQLGDQLYGSRTGVVELLDSLEPLEDRPRLVHEPKVAPLLSQMGDGFEPDS